MAMTAEQYRKAVRSKEYLEKRGERLDPRVAREMEEYEEAKAALKAREEEEERRKDKERKDRNAEKTLEWAKRMHETPEQRRKREEEEELALRKRYIEHERRKAQQFLKKIEDKQKSAQRRALEAAKREEITKKLRKIHPLLSRHKLGFLVEKEVKEFFYFDPIADLFPNACHGQSGLPFLFKKGSQFMTELRLAIDKIKSSDEKKFVDLFFQNMKLILFSYTQQVMNKYNQLVLEHERAFKSLMIEMASFALGELAGKLGEMGANKFREVVTPNTAELVKLYTAKLEETTIAKELIPSHVSAGISFALGEGKEKVYDKYHAKTLKIELQSDYTIINILADYAPGVSQWKGVMDLSYSLWYAIAAADEAKQYQYSSFPLILGNKPTVENFQRLFEQDLNLLRGNTDKILAYA